MNAARTPQGSLAVENRMRFTRREFWRGAWSAWLLFMIALTGTLVVTGVLQSGPPWGNVFSSIVVFLLYGIPIGGAVSLLVMLAGSPLAWGLGRLLVATDHVVAHLLAFAGLGAAIGAAVTASGIIGQPPAPFVAVVIVTCAISVAGGWYRTFWRSRQERKPWGSNS
ncbi:hypothetical protein [Microbacterium saperdae]|uniref:Uncharacterized protein n=1 Tax=Microbacterium saperdae TaxID=69368 RepID=A0A543BMH6_9MICO|nr:hypothetical protein [Microbacterium saperdae]TQL86021.1 hypothetical protein FB560_1659 [Microbacterium saperdae]GGM51203.1 hypothetical protein GCM10010489_23420 [Microbacterium saperdae]